MFACIIVAALHLSAGQLAPPVVPPSGVANRAGDRVTLCATVTATHARSEGAISLLVVGGRRQQNATIIVAAAGEGAADRYNGKAICATGTARKGADGPYVEVAGVQDIRDDTFGANAYRLVRGSGVTAPRVLRDAKPTYPPDALRAGIEGTVVVEAVVLPSGEVGEVRLAESLEPSLDRAALEAARQWTFLPGTRFNQPVPVVVTLELAFRTARPPKR